MKLPDLIGYLERQFSSTSEIVEFQIPLIAEENSGIIETVEINDEGGEFEPDEGEQRPNVLQDPRPRLRSVT
ncbi:hypothetical protein GCM10010909_33390 [Acidocella aquatica]|uniref:Uncharacterized protein n=1 Tax=Acidocella aquatica TaxID=1922313 RepID=A0ABQ6AA69_9PROT|nr:hypothetical protein [Acidocella aquatica]GLR68657.1 hypothetical protein GCM10010909_33390 [Acidocella aquatica]